MRPIQFGWVVPPGANFAPISDIPRDAFPGHVRQALDRISGAFDSVWVVDHFQFSGTDILECWTTLSYLAALYPSLNFGTLVLGQSYRNPALLAKMAATFQYLSGGRLLFGLGAGWKEDEYHAYGYDFPSNGVRVSQLDEAIQIIKALWTDEPATFTGRYYRVADARCEPKPRPRPPVMIGGKKPRMLRLIARHADWWNVDWVGLEAYRALVAQLEQTCSEVGRDPSTLRRTWFGWFACAPTEQAARSLANGRTGFVGTPAQIVEQMRPFVALGVDYFMAACLGFPDLTTPELLIAEVLPALRAEFGAEAR